MGTRALCHRYIRWEGRSSAQGPNRTLKDTSSGATAPPHMSSPPASHLFAVMGLCPFSLWLLPKETALLIELRLLQTIQPQELAFGVLFLVTLEQVLNISKGGTTSAVAKLSGMLCPIPAVLIGKDSCPGTALVCTKLCQE